MTPSPYERISPLHELLLPLQPEWAQIHGMAAPLRLPGDDRELSVSLSDVSCLPRMGIKGPRAEAWLNSMGVVELPGVNGWLRDASGLLVARLARSEFFLEDGFRGGNIAPLKQALAPASGVTPVLRQDAALVLTGARANELLTQVCNVNFRAWRPAERTVVMTTMVGVSVLALWEATGTGVRYRLWCDPTFAPYLWETLLEIAQDLGGAAVGLRISMPELSG